MNKKRKRKSSNKLNESELYKRASLFIRIGNSAVHGVQEKNRKSGIPNVYSFNGRTYFEMPNGKIVTKSPWSKLYKKKKIKLKTKIK